MKEISVLIPTYNCARYLKRCLDSLSFQTYSNFEVILVDDGSRDETAERVAEYRKTSSLEIRYLKQPNQGVSKARNVALSLAKGKWIAWVDADDAWKPEKLEKQVHFLEEHPECSAVFCKACNIIEGEDLKADPKALFLAESTDKMDLYLPSALLLKSLYDKYGPYDETLAYSEDMEWLMRFCKGNEKCHCLQEMLYIRHIHGQNLSLVKNPQTRVNWMQLCAKHLRRQHQRPLKEAEEQPS